MKKNYHLFLVIGTFIIIGFSAVDACAAKYRKGGESKPYSDYDFLSEEYPQTSPSLMEEEIDYEATEADPENLDFQAFESSLECNSCAGAGFTSSFAALPEKARKIWAYPDCSEANNVLIQSKYFSIWNGSGALLCMEPVVAVKEYPMFWSISTTSGETYVELTNDGLMRTAIPQATVNEDLKRKFTDEKWDIEKAGENLGREYASCGFYPREEFELLNYTRDFLPKLDKLVDVCAPQAEDVLTSEQKKKQLKECGSHIFKALDSDKSQTLDYLELSEAVLKSFLARDLVVKCASGRRFKKNHNELILDLVNDMISKLDVNEDLKLSKKELASIHEYLGAISIKKAKVIYADILNQYPFLAPIREIDISKLK